MTRSRSRSRHLALLVAAGLACVPRLASAQQPAKPEPSAEPPQEPNRPPEQQPSPAAPTAAEGEPAEPATPPSQRVAPAAPSTPEPAAEPTEEPAAPALPAEASPDGKADAAAEAQAADAAAEAQAAAIEEQLLAEAADTTEEYRVDLYGFADFSFVHFFQDFGVVPPYDSFAIGRLNVYVASELGDRWKSLAEVRFTYLPHGTTSTDPNAPGGRVDTTVSDYADLLRPVRWGGVIIERAWLEYEAHPLFNVRIGHWLTPYGIWNVDHGSPVIIGVRRPYTGVELLPESQTGIQIHGIYHLPQVQLGYHLTLSNGRGPVDTYQDLDKNKAIGARLFARADTPVGGIALGLTGYAGQYSDVTAQFSLDANGKFQTDYPATLRYDETSLAADLRWEWGGFLLQGEGILNDQVYDVRPVDAFASLFGGPPGFAPDDRRLAAYGLVGYRFDFLGTMPFGGFDWNRRVPGHAQAVWGGLNVRPTPRVVFKAQYSYSWISDDTPLNDLHLSALDLQAAWSF